MGTYMGWVERLIVLNFGFIQLNVCTLNKEIVVLISERRTENIVRKLNLNQKHSDTLS